MSTDFARDAERARFHSDLSIREWKETDSEVSAMPELLWLMAFQKPAGCVSKISLHSVSSASSVRQFQSSERRLSRCGSVLQVVRQKLGLEIRYPDTQLAAR